MIFRLSYCSGLGIRPRWLFSHCGIFLFPESPVRFGLVLGVVANFRWNAQWFSTTRRQFAINFWKSIRPPMKFNFSPTTNTFLLFFRSFFNKFSNCWSNFYLFCKSPICFEHFSKAFRMISAFFSSKEVVQYGFLAVEEQYGFGCARQFGSWTNRRYEVCCLFWSDCTPNQ